jgi:retinol dehydrogenase-12
LPFNPRSGHARPQQAAHETAAFTQSPTHFCCASAFTHQQHSDDCLGELTTLLVPDKGSRASAGAHAHRAGNPDRPARRQAHRTGAIAASYEDSPGRYEHVDVLANNAGALFVSREETPEGFERTFALNHLAPFLLTNLLRDRLLGGRVVTTASGAHRSGRLDLEDLQSEKAYSPRVYGTSKLCNVLFTRELARRAPELHANCFHPGVVRTGFAKNENGIWRVVATLGAPFLRSPERGARSLVWLARSDAAAALTGEYIEDEKVVAPSAQAQDDNLAEGLWEQSAQLVGLPADARA